ncbi:NAD(P)H-dependent oxidoreductase [Niveibacterium sp. SC-1]|uniref:FMN-dependent NADH-azoreductase n=1 Tax=Niveibacterium sp. SC-1 TaxID=3135646 RepID=UPI00311F0BBF
MSTASSRLLRIDASARTDGSHSRRLGDLVEAQWLRANPHGERVRRELTRGAPPHIAEATIQGFYTPPGQLTPALREATSLSDALVAELRAADTLLIASPMYNYGPPSALKAWVDQIVRVGHTFLYDAQGPRGLLQTRLVVLALVSGVPGTLGSAVDFLSPHLESVFKFMGVQRVATLHVDGTSGPADHVEAAMAAAERDAHTLFA